MESEIVCEGNMKGGRNASSALFPVGSRGISCLLACPDAKVQTDYNLSN